MVRKVIAALALTVALSAAGGAQNSLTATQRQLLGPMADDLSRRVGTWNVRANLQLQPGARPVSITATAHSRLVGGRWLVTELRGANQARGMAPFEGLGVNGYDPSKRKYVGFWIDGSRGIAVPVEGTFDAASRIFRTTSVETAANGRQTTVISETRPTGPDSEVTTFTAQDARGRPYTRMVLTYTRAEGASSTQKSVDE